MFNSQKHAFWEALFVTILIFALGVLAGFVLENWRIAKVDILYQNSEINLLDTKVQTDIYSSGFFDCESAIKENIDFANRIYEEAKSLDKYQKASVLKNDLVLSHKKYDLLRSMLLLNSVKIKQRCNAIYHDVVYFYLYNSDNIDLLAKEDVFSRILGELKQRKGNDILLIPIAADNNLTSADLLLKNYNVTIDQLPIIVIDSKIKITQIENVDEIMKYIE